MTEPRPRVVAIVQARMASTRLPGKVMHLIAGKPVLWHVIHRLKRCKMLDHIAIATSTSPHDDIIAAFGRENGVAVARGSEHNVLARYLLAAWQTDAEIIVRVSADAPFLDAAFIDHLVETLIAKGGDYVMLEPGASCAHEGVDPFTRRALEKLAREAARDSVAREHVAGYFKLNPDFVDVVHAPGYAGLAREPARLTVDTPDDIAFAEAVHARLAAQAGEASLEDLLWLIEREPGLKNINAHVRSKPFGRHAGRTIVCCDGGFGRGFGRVRRAAMLGRTLRDREGFGVIAAVNGDDMAANILQEAGLETVLLSRRDPGGALQDIVEARRPGIVICDCADGIEREGLSRIAERAPVVAVIDDTSDRRLAATHAYYPLPGAADALAWSASNTVRAGWEWSVIGFDPGAHAQEETLGEKTHGGRLRVAVGMGGADPSGHTRLAARALARLTAPFHARFIIGPGFAQAESLAREIESFGPNFTAVRDADMAAEFAGADLALATPGVTAWELAAMGVPALYFASDSGHAAASALENAGLGAKIEDLDENTIALAVLDLIRDSDRRHAMRSAGRATIDGKGAERIAADLAQALEKKAPRFQHAS